LKDSNASMGHARDCQPTPGQARTGDRRSGTRSARASATNAGLGVTYVPTHERPITWDICPEPRHPRSPLSGLPCSCSRSADFGVRRHVRPPRRSSTPVGRSAPMPGAGRLGAPRCGRPRPSIAATTARRGGSCPGVGGGPRDKDRRLAPASAGDLAVLGQDHAKVRTRRPPWCRRTRERPTSNGESLWTRRWSP
jgi:hypothetical protein